MKNMILGMMSALISGLVMILLMKSEAFNSASDNSLLITLMLFFVAMIGLGIGKVTGMLFDDKSGKKSKKKKSGKEFEDESSGFIGDGRF